MRTLRYKVACALLLLGACRSADPLEMPGGRELRVTFEGNESFSADELREALRARAGDFVLSGTTKAAVDDAAFVLELFYRDRGFPDAIVEYDYEAGEDVVTAAFTVEEGRRLRVSEFTVEGNEFVDDEEVRTFFGARDDWPFVNAEIESGTDKLLTYYEGLGYRGATVESSTEIDEGTTTVHVRVVVDEGPRYRVRRIGFAGRHPLDKSALDGLVSEFVGAPFNRRVSASMRSQVADYAEKQGYPDCTVEVQRKIDDRTGDVTLVLAVDTGPQVTVEKVEVRGERRVRASFIRSRVELEPGDRYHGGKVRDSFRNLYRTGLFESVSIELGPGETERALVVTVVEAPTLEFFVEPGYGSYEGPRLRLGVEKRSIFGTDRSVRFESTVGWKAQEANVQLVDPWMFDVDLTGTATFFGGRRVEPSFTERDYGAGLGFRRRWSSRWTTNAAYNFTRSVLEDVDIDDPPDAAFVDDVDIGSITLGVTRDDRNNIFYPTGGSRESVTFEWGDSWLGGELEFLSGRFEGALFQSLFSPSTVLGVSARTGVIVPVGSSDEIPLQRRFFNGGENTVRSFGESELGPKDSSGDPVGGEAFNVLSVEIRQTLNDPLSVALFYDLGNVVVDHEDYFDFADFSAGVGGGVRYLLPIGAVRLDAAWNPDPESDDDDWAIHLSVGMAF